METRRLKQVATIIAGQSPDSCDVHELAHRLPFIQGTAEFGLVSPLPKYECANAPKVAERHDVLLSVRAPVGAINVADCRIGIGRGVCAIRPSKGMCGAYLRYVLTDSNGRLQALAQGSTFEAVTAAVLGSIPVPYPGVPTQSAIADFLDEETARVDELLAEKEGFIALLAEKRAALIAHAVTNGLNPDVEMKDSGVEWLGEVPAEWEIARAKHVLANKDDRSGDGEGELLTVSHITGVTSRAQKQVHMFLAETTEGYKRCDVSDFVINTMWAFEGAAGIAFLPGLVSPSYNVYRFIRSVDPRWFDYLARCRRLVKEYERRSKGITRSRLRLYPDEFLDIRIPLPSVEEQQAIADYLDSETALIDELVEATRESITLLREYRSALISAAVTGKIDVSAYAATEGDSQ